MTEFLSKLFDTTDFPARWYCGNWTNGEGWLHILSDLGIWSAYTAIPLVLLYFATKRRDIPFSRMFLLFSAFIVLCGLTHLLEAVIFWQPIYRFAGVVKLTTAVVSWGTVLALIKIAPGVLQLPSLASTNTRLREEIRQRVEVEQDLRRLQDRYEALLNGTRSIVWTANRRGQLTVPQPAWERFTGHEWGEYQGRPWLYSLHPHDQTSVEQQWRATEQEAVAFRGQGRVWHASSSDYRPCVIEAVPVLDANGHVYEWVGTISDVHEQRLAEEALRNAEAAANQQRAELELIYDTAPVGMNLIDREHRFLRINDHLASINGFKREEHYGRLAYDLLPGLAEHLRPLYQSVFDSGQPLLNVEIEGETHGKPEKRCWLVSFHPLVDQHGVWAVSTIVQDITDRKKLEQSLRESREQAQQANMAKSAFLANMSHEIRTPMAAILGYADVLSEQIEDPEQCNCVSIIRRNGEHLLGLINDILDLSRIEAGRFDINLEPVDLLALLDDVHTLMQVRADEKSLKLDVQTLGRVPKFIKSDATRLRQVLINLLGNAIKFTDQGQVQLVVQLLQEGPRRMLELAVHDTGIGMNPTQCSRLFQPFSQGDSTVSRQYGGSGLGLAISQRLVHLLQGELTFESQPGKGSVFYVRLLLPTDNDMTLVESMPAPGPSARPAAQPGARKLDCRILVVDDRRDVRYISQHFLERAGARVSTAEDGEQGIAIALDACLREEPFSVILMDMQMPRMDGLEATRRLRQKGIETPIIALTADAMKGDRERFIQGGCDDYLSKPIDQSALIQMISYYCHELTAADISQRRAQNLEKLTTELSDRTSVP
jgi:PAS domain S-box-containing protein